MCRRWWAQRDELRASDETTFRVRGGGRKPVLGGFENELLDLIVERRVRKEKVSRQWIAEVAIGMGLTDFVASGHWVTNFMHRNGLSLRHVTNLTTLSDDELISGAVAYMQFLQSQLVDFDGERAVLMDETAVYFEDPRKHSVDRVGARHVVIKSTGFQSMRITAILAITVAGKKLPPMLVWKGKGDEIKKVNGCYVAQQPRAWVDQSLLIKWLDIAFPQLWQACSKTIVWDSMRAHIGKLVKAHCAQRKISMCVIPGGMTAYLQAGDLGIYKSFKDKIAPFIDQWKHSDTVEYTRGGNPKPPSVEVVTEWIREAWRQVPDDVVKTSELGFPLTTGSGTSHVMTCTVKTSPRRG
ncbi:hypothetical protein P43SY_001644 [Pythium insidiosum]|uniref:HTH CENPB-type domain-containing protein n=1 Tax=Pythium insidiosum TaxID=114742 RepID=A0AAD5L8D3_PYTIN|nr:hypothetical protein P43SY_001644 [Pythium insidiosum]